MVWCPRIGLDCIKGRPSSRTSTTVDPTRSCSLNRPNLAAIATAIRSRHDESRPSVGNPLISRTPRPQFKARFKASRWPSISGTSNLTTSCPDVEAPDFRLRLAQSAIRNDEYAVIPICQSLSLVRSLASQEPGSSLAVNNSHSCWTDTESERTLPAWKLPI